MSYSSSSSGGEHANYIIFSLLFQLPPIKGLVSLAPTYLARLGEFIFEVGKVSV
jgi:hypothetical protein